MKISLFKKINQTKMDFSFQDFDSHKENIVNFIPLLLHFNIPHPPFHIKNIYPCGIYDYVPSRRLMKNFNEYFSTSIKPSLYRPKKIKILSLLSIGSFGTIAYKKDSDIDYWVIVKNNTNKEKLKRKLTKLEKIVWDYYNLEIHFFIMTQDDIKNNKFGSASGESAGSSLGILLKEEFYRTATYFAGQIPEWFITKNKDQHKDLLIDLGSFSGFPLEELYGAAIWHILKGTESPLKSSVKFSLINYYLSNKSKFSFLANELIKEQTKKSEYIDPYLFLYKKILYFYNEKKTMKINSLSDIKKLNNFDFHILCITSFLNTNKNFRKLYLKKFKKILPFSEKFISFLNNYDKWNLNKYKLLNDIIIKFIFNLYNKIKNKVIDKKAYISKKDLTVIGRKLDSKLHYKRKKIMDYTIIPIYPNEKLFILNEHKGHFTLYKNRVKKNNIIIESQSVLGIIAWMLKNNFELKKINFNISSESNYFNINTFKLTYNKLYNFIDNKHEYTYSGFLRKYYIKNILIFPNLHDRNNKKINDIQIIYKTTWGELFYNIFSVHPVDKFLEKLYPLIQKESEYKILFLDNYHYKPNIKNYLELILYDIEKIKSNYDNQYDFFIYILYFSKKYIIIKDNIESFEIIRKNNIKSLFYFLMNFEINKKKYILFNSLNSSTTLLNNIYEHASINSINLYLNEDIKNKNNLVVLDENNNIYSFYLKKHNELIFINKLITFLKNITSFSINLYKIFLKPQVKIINMTNKYKFFLNSKIENQTEVFIKSTDNKLEFIFDNKNISIAYDKIYKLKKYFNDINNVFIKDIQFNNKKPIIKYIELYYKIIKNLK